MARLTKANIREIIDAEFRTAGWSISGNCYQPPQYADKAAIRSGAASHRFDRAEKERAFVIKNGDLLLRYFAEGREINPLKFDPILIPAETGELSGDLFRLATLFWSIPVSRGYGRRMRYIMMDQSNNRLVGIFALGDPVFNLAARDRDIDWTSTDRMNRLYHVLDAYVLGAVPPYNMLLCGKLIALSTITNQIRTDFNKKYRQARNEHKTASLTLVTTTSSLGRSSIYNRLRLPNEQNPAFNSVGYSAGWGHFQIRDEAFASIRTWLRQHDESYADRHQYGDGPNWKMRTIRQAFQKLDISQASLKHGIQREVFLAPLAKNYRSYLRGDAKAARYYDRPMDEVIEYFKERWMIPRSYRTTEWQNWTRQNSRDQLSQLFREIIGIQQVELF